MRYFNALGAVPFLLAGLFAIYEARTFPTTGALGVGPRFFPVSVAEIMIAFAVALVLLSLLGRETFTPTPVTPRVFQDWAVTAAAAAISLVVWRRLGYVAASFVLVLALVQYFERDRRWWRSVLFSGAITALIWVLFAALLDVPVGVVG